MARLPQPGGDDGNWGNILNTFLQVAHTSDGNITIPTWPDSNARPSSPEAGQAGVNLNTGQIERYNGSSWVEVSQPRVITGTSVTPPNAANYEDGTIYFQISSS